jgi:hypothetical protein
MSKKPLDIDRQVMTDILNKLELAKTYTNRNALFEDASSEYHSARGLKVSPAVIYLRVKEWQLTLKTANGKRGRAPGSGPVPQGERHKKLKNNSSLKAMRAEWTADKDAKPFMKLIDKIANGSLKSAIKANCIACANFQREEVKHCQVVSCPLHSIRPYQ